jgi:hypothetical protein
MVVVLSLVTATMTSSSGAATSSSSSKSSSWVGVGELVVVQLDSTGKASGTPYQHTEITASSSGTVKVQVPMSSSGLRNLGKGKPPAVSNGVADFSLTPNGTTTETVRSDLATALPLTVTPSYELNGKPTTAADLDPTRHRLRKQYQSGTLHVTYKIANVTKAKTTVSFEGFNGAHVQQTITQPLPIVAEVKLTFPKSATSISAPNATLAQGHSGVGATWTLAFAPPLSAATQTISYSVDLSEVKVPETTVEAEVLAPKAAPSGKAPAQAAAALASLEGTPEPGLSGPSVSLGGVHSDLSRPQQSTASTLDTQQRAKKTAATDEGKSRSSAGAMQSDFTNVSQTQALATQDNGSSADAQLNNLQATANQALGNVAAQSSSNASKVTADLTNALSAMTQSISSLALTTVKDIALQEHHVASVDALKAAVNALGTLVANLLTVVKNHADDATAMDALLVTLIADANGLSAGEKSTPEWATLASDLATAKAKADLLTAAAADIAHGVVAISSAAHDLQIKVNALDAEARALETGAEQLGSQIGTDVAAKEDALEASVASVSGQVASVNASIAAGMANVAAAKSNAHAELNSVQQTGSAKVASATDQATAKVHDAVASAQAALDKANNDYAQLVAVSQIAIAHQLPGGNATGANVQNGAWVYRISGTS